MKHTFLLDENIVILATTMRDEKGNDDYSSAILILEIFRNCHSLAVNSKLYAKYLMHTNSIPLESRGFKAIRVINDILHINAKNRWIEAVSEYEFEKDIPADDREIVKTAVLAQAILVSADGRLCEKIKTLGLERSHGLVIVTPKDAMKYVTNFNP